MNWLSQNWLWILLGLAVLLVLGRGRHRGSGVSHHGYESSENAGAGSGGPMPPEGLGRGEPPPPPASRAASAVDPVTREDVSTDKALTSIYQGRIYYFASAESRQRFEASPAQFAREELGHTLAPAESLEPRRARRRGGC